MIVSFVATAALSLLICLSVDRQLPFRGGRLLAFAVSVAIATAAVGFLTGGLGLPGLVGGAVGAGAGLALGKRPD